MHTSTMPLPRQRAWAMGLSLFVGFVLMGLKFYVYWLTNSSAVLSDALESIINVVASSFALGSVIMASRPPDPTHPYGHGKIEHFSAGFEGALIILAAVGIAQEAWPQILHPKELPNLGNGLWILLITSVANLALGLMLVRTGRSTKSFAVEADGKHILTDVITSMGVLLGLLLVHFTKWFWLDGIIACLMAVSILVVGFSLIRRSYAGLMDASDFQLLETIAQAINHHRRDVWIDVHQLRAWRSGDRIYADFHLILPRELTLEEAHEEVTELQNLLKSHLDGVVEALIHAEPCLDPDCPICGYNPCKRRQTPHERQNLWNTDTVVATSEGEQHASDSES